MQFFAKTIWKAKDIIRNQNGDPFLVLHVYTHIATLVVNLKSATSDAIIILPRDYDKYTKDMDLKRVETPVEIVWQKELINI